MRDTFFSALVIFGLFACEAAVEVDVPRNATKPTVNAFFTPDSVWSVELSENRYILDSDQFESLPEATVEVWQNEQFVTELQYQSDNIFRRHSIYRATDAYPQVGIPYTLRVDHPRHTTLVASSQVPPTPKIVSGSLDILDVRQDNQLNSNEVAYGLTLLLDDPPEENFYSLSVILRWDGFGTIDINGSGMLLLEENTKFIDIQSDDPMIDNTFGNYRDELLFKDVSFNGQQYELKVYGVLESDDPRYIALFEGGFILQEDAYDKEGNIMRQAGDTAEMNTLCVVLRNTTEEYYNYNYTRDLQASVESNPFAQPVQVFDNIEGGLGIFAGYSQVEKEVTIR